ncbi:MAG: hypothetical protein RQM90_13460 [Methanoculleus sp.]
MGELRLELESFAEEQRLKEAALKAARAEVADLKRRCDEGAAIEDAKNQKEKDVQQTETARKKVADDRSAIDRRRKKIDDMVRYIDDAQREADDLQAEVRVELRAAEGYHDTWKNTHEPILRQVETELDTLQAVERIRRFEEQAVGIQERIDHIRATEEELRNLEHTLATTPLPTKKDLTTYQKKKLELASLQGQIEQAAIRIGFNLQDTPITADPATEYLAEDEEYLVLGPTTFTIGGLGTVRVRGGGSSLEDLQTKTQSLSADVTSLSERFGVTEEQELYDLQQRRQELELGIRRSERPSKTSLLSENQNSSRRSSTGSSRRLQPRDPGSAKSLPDCTISRAMPSGRSLRPSARRNENLPERLPMSRRRRPGLELPMKRDPGMPRKYPTV